MLRRRKSIFLRFFFSLLSISQILSLRAQARQQIFPLRPDTLRLSRFAWLIFPDTRLDKSFRWRKIFHRRIEPASRVFSRESPTGGSAGAVYTPGPHWKARSLRRSKTRSPARDRRLSGMIWFLQDNSSWKAIPVKL